MLRIGVGVFMFLAGWEKITNLSGTVAGFAHMGFNPFWTYMAIAAEIVGGLAVLLGIGTRIASIFLTITMAVAIFVVPKDLKSLMSPSIFLFASVALVLAGGGKFSLIKGK